METYRTASTDDLDELPLRWPPSLVYLFRPDERRYCGRRVAVLYLAGESFACRCCCGLAYASQQKDPLIRNVSRSQKIRVRLGGNRTTARSDPREAARHVAADLRPLLRGAGRHRRQPVRLTIWRATGSGVHSPSLRSSDAMKTPSNFISHRLFPRRAPREGDEHRH